MFGWIGLLCLCLAGCKSAPPANQVVIYALVDAAVAKPILDQFQKQTGITVVLAKRAPGEEFHAKSKPSGDVLWDEDCWETMDWADAGVLAGYVSPAAEQISKEYKDAGGRWAGMGLRWRVLAVTRCGDGAPLAGTVHHVVDLADPAFAGRVGLGVAQAGDLAAYAAQWGDAQTQAFLKALHDNKASSLDSAALALQVGQGTLWAGYCDAGAVAKAKAAGGKLDAIFPDQDGAGMLMVPCTVGLVAGAPHPQQAQLLIDYLLSRGVEKKLLDAGYAQSSVFEKQKTPKAMGVDWKLATQKMNGVQKEMGTLGR
jgi:iron(III) transport system substrate-binding protein